MTRRGHTIMRLLSSGTYPERFLEHVRKTRTCWLWIGAVRPDGYARMDDQYVHRLAWRLYYGRIPPKKCVLHHCDVRNCVRPSHLWLGTNLENTHDCIRKGRNSFGSRHPHAKLIEQDIPHILKSYTGRHGEIVALANQFGIRFQNVWDVLLNKF